MIALSFIFFFQFNLYILFFQLNFYHEIKMVLLLLFTIDILPEPSREIISMTKPAFVNRVLNPTTFYAINVWIGKYFLCMCLKLGQGLCISFDRMEHITCFYFDSGHSHSPYQSCNYSHYTCSEITHVKSYE